MERDSSGRFIRGARGEQYQQQRPDVYNSGSNCSVGATVASVLSAAALGAVAMYLMDPSDGERRRAMAKKLAEQALEHGSEFATAAMHGASHFMGDAMHAAKDKFDSASSAVSDAMPSGNGMRKAGKNFMSSASDTASDARDKASDWLTAAKDMLPRRAKLEQHSDYAMNPGAVGATALSTLAIGAGAMWLFDPAKGRARRAWVGQKLTRFVNDMGQFARSTGRHLTNRSKGMYHQSMSAMQDVAERVTGAAE